MTEDGLWYEAALVVGITNALNVAADALAPDGTPMADLSADGEADTVFAEIRGFYARDDVPAAFRVLAGDPAYLADVWAATRHAFTDQRLSRRFKEAIAFAVSVTTRSVSGTAFHLGEMRRLGVGPRGVLEILGVTQMFSSYTKIADTLQLDPDMVGIGPVDTSPAPGGPASAHAAHHAERDSRVASPSPR
jgi:alkylhydroperoxidase/carboxymuconolactone decarboxylase family protein YurZ